MTVPVLVVVMVAVLTTPICSAFGLKGRCDLEQFGTKATEHVLDHMIGSDKKGMLSNLRRQMAISQMPREPCQLMAIRVPDLDQRFGSSSNPDPVAVIELQTIAIGHRNCLRKVEKNILTVVRREANSPAMTSVEIQSKSADSLLVRPVSSAAMDGGVLHHCPQYRK
jgi:hypothetical protein